MTTFLIGLAAHGRQTSRVALVCPSSLRINVRRRAEPADGHSKGLSYVSFIQVLSDFLHDVFLTRILCMRVYCGALIKFCCPFMIFPSIRFFEPVFRLKVHRPCPDAPDDEIRNVLKAELGHSKYIPFDCLLRFIVMCLYFSSYYYDYFFLNIFRTVLVYMSYFSIVPTCNLYLLNIY